MDSIPDDPMMPQWLLMNSNIFYSYWMMLTLGQEIELIWKQHWSLITVLYLVIHYIGIPYSVHNIVCLSLWIAVKHSHDLRRLGPSMGEYCFGVMMKYHFVIISPDLMVCQPVTDFC
ncbi:hypothetical protein BDR04DRAFT_1095473, partial [Suillus decipiens]